MENEERIQNVKGTGGIWYICLNELDKVCFQHDLANDYYRDLPRRSPRSLWIYISDYKFFDKKSKETTNHAEDGISNVIPNNSNYIVN